MGLREWLKKKFGKRKSEKSELRKAFEKKRKSERTVTLRKSESLPMPEQVVYSPAVEHPLLTIQDKISRLEEIYKGLSERIERRVATKEDVKEVKELIKEGLEKEENILVGINKLDDRMEQLERKKRELTQKVSTKSQELAEDVKQLEKVERELLLLETDKKILETLSREPLSTIELSEKLGYTRQYLWSRLKEMEKHGLIKKRREGRKTKYFLDENTSTNT